MSHVLSSNQGQTLVRDIVGSANIMVLYGHFTSDQNFSHLRGTVGISFFPANSDIS